MQKAASKLFSRKSWESIKEYFVLFALRIKLQFCQWVEFLHTAYRYYRNWTFCKIDLSLLATYAFHSPFMISKRYLIEKGEKKVHAYGETPFTSLEEIVTQCRITAKDTVLELGCGRGRTCFWLHCFVGCRVIGIEYVPLFVERAKMVSERFKVPQVEFRLQDMTQMDAAGVTVVYLYGTCLEDEVIERLVVKFKGMPSGSKIITVSYPLTDYEPKQFEVLKCFPIHYPWGTADVYLNIRK